jgi:hypothetical protein
MSFATSYSSCSSWRGSRNGIAFLAVGRVGRGEAEVELLAARPICVPVTPSSVARSSSSENGCGSMTFTLSLPPEREAELVEEVLHALAVVLDVRNRRRRCARRRTDRDSPAP